MASLTTKDKRWYKGIVPFALDELDFPDATDPVAKGIHDAIKEWNSQVTNVTIKPHKGEPTFLLFKRNSFTTSGGSTVGMGFGIQIIWAVAKASQGATKVNMLHEIGHALGLNHEACRHDRDDNINIDFSNIQHIPFTSYYQNQFDIEPDGTDFGRYDFFSRMHYLSSDYAQDPNKPVITKKDGSLIGPNTTLSQIDIDAIEFFYSDINSTTTFYFYQAATPPQNGRVIHPPSITITPPPITVAVPPLHIPSKSFNIQPEKFSVKPPSVHFMGYDIDVPSFDVTPPSLTFNTPPIDFTPNPVTAQPPPITITPPPIIIY
jgi:hypothetical protein